MNLSNIVHTESAHLHYKFGDHRSVSRIDNAHIICYYDDL